MSDPLGVASKVQVAEVPASEPEPKPKAGPPPTKSDFPATPAQSAQALENGGKIEELKEQDGKPVSSQDGAQRAAAEAASGKSSKAENPGTSKQEAPEALSDKPGEKQGDKKRGITEPKVHYYKEPEVNGENEGGSSFESAVRRPKEEVETGKRDATEWEYGYQKWLVPGAVAVLVLGVTIVVVSAWSKNRQPSSR